MVDLSGIIPAIVTPFAEDGSIDADAVPPYVEWLVEQGPVALAVNVDTGEGPHLTREERRWMIETVRRVADARCAVVAGVGGPSTRDGVANAREAEAAGADAFLVFPIPAFLSTPLRADIAVRYHESIADATNRPIILFQLQPALGGVIFADDVMDRLLAIEAVEAVKEASFDRALFSAMHARIKACGRQVALLTGNDNFIGESFELGADGALLGFATLGTREHVQLQAAVRRGNVADAEVIGARLQRLADVIFAPPVGDYRARTKVALKHLGVLPGTTVREPLLPISDADAELVRREVDLARFAAAVAS